MKTNQFVAMIITNVLVGITLILVTLSVTPSKSSVDGTCLTLGTADKMADLSINLAEANIQLQEQYHILYALVKSYHE